MGRLWRGEHGRFADSLVSVSVICGECWWRRWLAEAAVGMGSGGGVWWLTSGLVGWGLGRWIWESCGCLVLSNF